MKLFSKDHPVLSMMVVIDSWCAFATEGGAALSGAAQLCDN